MKRTLTTASVVSLPTRRTTPSWITRNSFACVGLDISSSSSRKSVPPFAVSSRPALSRTAPVNAPLQCPNISDSSSASGRAAQFRATSGLLLRRLWAWMNCAINSLPEPLAPVMNTDASVGATRRARSIAWRNIGETPRTWTRSLLPCSRELRLLLLGFDRDAHGVDRPPDENLEMRRREWLGEIVPGAQPQRFDARCDARVSRHHDDDRLGARLHRDAQQLVSGNVAHVEVEQHDVEAAMPQQLQGLLSTTSDADAVAVDLQQVGATLPQRPVVIDDEEPDAGLDRGRERRQADDFRWPGGGRVKVHGAMEWCGCRRHRA